MRVAVHITDRVLFTWPQEYWSELIGDLVKDGHDVFVFTDDKHINLAIENPKVHKCFNFTDEEVKEVIAQCDVFFGVPLRFSDISKVAGIRIINLLGSTSNGTGIVSPLVCQGCLDKGNSEIDCIFTDELCYWRITPIMAKKELYCV